MLKTCRRCSTEKSFEEFSRNSASPDGRYSLCKACKSVVAKAYRERPEIAARETERLRLQHIRDRDARNASRRARYASNPSRELARNRAYESKDRDFWRAWRRSYYHRNKDLWVGIVARRRARVLGAGGIYDVEDVRQLYRKQDALCTYCRCDLTKFEVDHIIPLSRGGSNEPRNLQLLCMPCNRSKADKLPHEFAAYRASLGLPAQAAGRSQGEGDIRVVASGAVQPA